MIISEEKYKIVSDFLVSKIDFEQIYDDTNSYSKSLFTKEHIIDHIRNLILKYPNHFDTSIKDRIEMGVSVFDIKFGILNEYIYLVSKYRTTDNWWYITNDNLLEYIEQHKADNNYYVILNMEHFLRRQKINKIWENIISTKIISLIRE